VGRLRDRNSIAGTAGARAIQHLHVVRLDFDSIAPTIGDRASREDRLIRVQGRAVEIEKNAGARAAGNSDAIRSEPARVNSHSSEPTGYAPIRDCHRARHDFDSNLSPTAAHLDVEPLQACVMGPDAVGFASFALAHANSDAVGGGRVAHANVTELDRSSAVNSCLSFGSCSKSPTANANPGDENGRVAVALIFDVDAIASAISNFDISYRHPSVRAALKPNAVMVSIENGEVFEKETVNAAGAECMTHGRLQVSVSINREIEDAAALFTGDIDRVAAGPRPQPDYR
jgi:hypothetical protein